MRQHHRKRGFSCGAMSDDDRRVLIGQDFVDFFDRRWGINPAFLIFAGGREDTYRSAEVDSTYDFSNAVEWARCCAQAEIVHPEPGMNGRAQPGANILSKDYVNVFGGKRQFA